MKTGKAAPSAIQGERYLIGHDRGGIHGCVGRRAIVGRATRIEAAEAERRPWPDPVGECLGAVLAG